MRNAACGQSREASTFIVSRLKHAKPIGFRKENEKEKKGIENNIGATFTLIYFTISINRSSDLNLNSKMKFISELFVMLLYSHSCVAHILFTL